MTAARGRGQNYIRSDNDAIKIDSFTFDLFLPGTGTYDIFTFFDTPGFEPPELVFKRGVTIRHSSTLEIRSTDAPHLINLEGVDEQGRLLSSLSEESGRYTSRYVFMYPLNGRTTILLESDSLYSSPLPDGFTLFSAEAYHDLGNSNNIYMIQHPPLSGVTRDISLPSQASDLISQNLNIFIPPYAENPHLAFLVSFITRFSSLQDHSLQGIEGGRIPVSPGQWQGKLYVTPDIDENYGFVPTIRTTVDTLRKSIGDAWMFTDDFRIREGRLGFFQYVTPSPDIYFAQDGATMHLGNAPIFPDIHFVISTSKISASVLFRGSLNESRYYDTVFTDFAIYNNLNNLVASGNMQDSQSSGCDGPCIGISVDPGIHRLEFINTGYFAGPVRGQARFSSRFDTRSTDPTPPILTSLKLLNSEGVPVGNLRAVEPGTLEFSAADDYFFADDGSGLQYRSIVSAGTRLYLKPSTAEEWQEVKVTKLLEDSAAINESGHHPIGFLYRAQVSNLVQFESGSMDLRIELLDQGGNSAEWLLEPAFTIGDMVDPGTPAGFIPLNFALYDNYPNPFNPSTTIRYDLPENTHVVLRIYNVLGQVVRTLVNENQTAGVKWQVWDGRDDLANPVSSGVYLYGIDALAFKQTKKLLLLK